MSELDHFVAELENATSFIRIWLRTEKSERVKRQAEHVIGCIEVLIPMAIDDNSAPSQALVIRRLREQAKDHNILGRAADLLEITR